MLAEIFFLKLEMMARASEEAAQARNPRYVPYTRDPLSGPAERQGGEHAKRI
jgi:hypothetical protein